MDHRELINIIIRRGWSIFPCGQDKKPLTRQGYKNATRDKTKILSWCETYPNFKIGIPCADNYFFAVDIDPQGIKTWNGWVNEFGKPGPGPKQHTPRGGMHILYKLPVGLPVPNTAGKLEKGIDLRSNGYICTGDGYTWETGDHGIDAQLAEAPAWLLEKIRAYVESRNLPESAKVDSLATKDPLQAGDYWLQKALAQARPGNRNQTGFDLACQLRDSGLSRGEAEVYMRKYLQGVPKCEDPYTLSEALASLKEAFSAPAREPAHFRGSKASVIEELIPSSLPSSAEFENIPVATFLRSDQVVRLNKIAVSRGLPLHVLLNQVVGGFLRNFDDNKKDN
jgi:hypothetical protein